MKTRIYLKVAKTKKGIEVEANTAPSFIPFKRRISGVMQFYPTVQMALDITIDDKEFDASRILLEAKITSPTPCAEITQQQINEEDVSTQ